MRIFTNKQMKQLLEVSGIGIDNSKDDPLVLEKIKEFGYTAESLAAAEVLHNEAEDLYFLNREVTNLRSYVQEKMNILN